MDEVTTQNEAVSRIVSIATFAKMAGSREALSTTKKTHL